MRKRNKTSAKLFRKSSARITKAWHTKNANGARLSQCVLEPRRKVQCTLRGLCQARHAHRQHDSGSRVVNVHMDISQHTSARRAFAFFARAEVRPRLAFWRLGSELFSLCLTQQSPECGVLSCTEPKNRDLQDWTFGRRYERLRMRSRGAEADEQRNQHFALMRLGEP